MPTDPQKRTLVVSPHLDDALLGAYSFLGNNSFVLYLTWEYVQNGQVLLDRAKAFASAKRFNYQVLDLEPDQLQRKELARPLESCIESFKPETIVLPGASRLGDISEVYAAAVQLCQPSGSGWFIPNVIMYESPLCWDTGALHLSYFRELDVEEKLDAWRTFGTSTSVQTCKSIQSIGHVRGQSAALEAAEAFEVKRLISGKGTAL